MERKDRLLTDIQGIDGKEEGFLVEGDRVNRKNLQVQFHRLIFQGKFKWR